MTPCKLSTRLHNLRLLVQSARIHAWNAVDLLPSDEEVEGVEEVHSIYATLDVVLEQLSAEFEQAHAAEGTAA